MSYEDRSTNMYLYVDVEYVMRVLMCNVNVLVAEEQKEDVEAEEEDET